MADEYQMAGAPKVFIAAHGSVMPSLAGTSITWTNNEVQTITPAGTWTSGTYTLEFVNPLTGVSETTADIAYNAVAADIKAALAALADLAATDLTVTGGPLSATGPVVPVVVTFGGAWANTPIAALNISVAGIVGGGTATVARTNPGRLWTQITPLIKDFKEKPFDKSEVVHPLHAEAPTAEISTGHGIESLAMMLRKSDLTAFNIALPSTLISTQAPGASQAGYNTLAQPKCADMNASYYTIAAQYTGPAAGWGIVKRYFKCKRDLGQDFTASAVQVRDIALVFKCYEDETNSDRTWVKYQYNYAPTS
jgi:hypothetical protein